MVTRKDGTPVLVTFENVRCVPDFGYTLLLVKQLWREQKINSLFADDQCLVLENGDRLPYDHGTELPTVRIICASKLLATIPTRDGTALPAVATPATAVRPPPTPRRPRHRLPDRRRRPPRHRPLPRPLKQPRRHLDRNYRLHLHRSRQCHRPQPRRQSS